MSSIILDEYRTSWALRYLREAEADISTAKKNPLQSVSIRLALTAMRKSQTAIYYSLGDPEYIAPLVNQNVVDGKKTKDNLMNILVKMEQIIQRDNSIADNLNKNDVIERANYFLITASEIVNLMLKDAEETSVQPS